MNTKLCTLKHEDRYPEIEAYISYPIHSNSGKDFQHATQVIGMVRYSTSQRLRANSEVLFCVHS